MKQMDRAIGVLIALMWFGVLLMFLSSWHVVEEAWRGVGICFVLMGFGALVLRLMANLGQRLGDRMDRLEKDLETLKKDVEALRAGPGGQESKEGGGKP
jgi:hypothetical protein